MNIRPLVSILTVAIALGGCAADRSKAHDERASSRHELSVSGLPESMCERPAPEGEGAACPEGTKCRPHVVAAVCEENGTLNPDPRCRVETWRCKPVGPDALGEICSSDGWVDPEGKQQSTKDSCDASTYCLPQFSGRGVCMLPCNPEDGGNAQCPTGSSCMWVAGLQMGYANFGLCSIPCTPATSGTACGPETSCKLNQIGKTFTCGPDGPRREGEFASYYNPTYQCGPGLSPWFEDDQEALRCRLSCDTAAPDCPSDERCNPVAGAPDGVGICQPPYLTLAH